MVAFHLLQLPLVAIEHVLSMMNPYEWINLSLVSSRSKRTVKNYLRINKPQYKIRLEFSRNPHILISGQNETWGFGWGTDESRAGYEHETLVKHVTHIIYKYSRNPMEKLMKWYDYIKGILGCQIEKVDFDLKLYPTQNKLFTDWLRSQQNSIAKMDITKDEEGFEDDLKYVINNITITDEIFLYINRYKDDFRMEIPTVTHSICINDSRFINFEQLLRLKNPCIWLIASVLTARDINGFLRSWMAFESHLELESFQISFSGAITMDVIMDLPHEETDDPNLIAACNKKFDTPIVEKWFNIKRSDGKVATVGYQFIFNEHRFYMLTH